MTEARPGGLTRREIEGIYERFGFVLHRRCRALLRDRAAADDALQEVFINLIKYGRAYREVEAKLPWLYRVADRCCFAALDRRAKLPTPMGEPVELPPAPVEIGEERRLEDRQRVLSMLSQLSPEDRNLAVLAFVEERDQGEIGRLLGFSRQTINKRLKSLRARALEVVEAES
ncbi:MAG: sigma-70 family RNA polymerase sigma factor [Myxococcota bacterium]